MHQIAFLRGYKNISSLKDKDDMIYEAGLFFWYGRKPAHRLKRRHLILELLLSFFRFVPAF